MKQNCGCRVAGLGFIVTVSDLEKIKNKPFWFGVPRRCVALVIRIYQCIDQVSSTWRGGGGLLYWGLRKYVKEGSGNIASLTILWPRKENIDGGWGFLLYW